jgi:alkylation response protein AidB-like acyl-CoA dehydrogenase
MRALGEDVDPRFRQALRTFLDRCAPPEASGGVLRTFGGIPDWARRWQATLYDNGWLVPENTPALGGRNASGTETLVYLEEMARRGLVRSAHYPGYGIVAPTLAEFGGPDQQELAARAARGDDIWCIGMSEPDAGSDLAALRTKATNTGAGFIVSGRKIWTSYAPLADRCLCYVRTDAAAPPTSGMSVLIVDMRARGVEVRPLLQITGQWDFAEVLFDEVEVPHEALVGRLGDGWHIARTSLSFERRGLWTEWLAGIAYGLNELVGKVTSNVAGCDPVVADSLAGLHHRAVSLFALGLRGAPGAAEDELGAHSMLKLAMSEIMVDMNDLAVRLGHPDSLLGGRDGSSGNLFSMLLKSVGDTIGGGTAEMQRNAIARQLLEVPRATHGGSRGGERNAQRR